MSYVCSNCGNVGHFFRECSVPITSLGIIAFRLNGRPGLERVEWLMIRRRVSIGYIELMRGKYEIGDVEGIQALVNQTTMDEREKLCLKPFVTLWHDLWNGPASRRYQTEFEHAKAKLDVIRSRGVLETCCTKSVTNWMEPEWGFPKGRRSSTETELACALRETHEEAGVKPEQLTVLDVPPLIEEYRGSNGIVYRHRYWLAMATSHLEVGLDSTNVDQIREVSDVRWCTTEEAYQLIRPYSVEKRNLLHLATEQLISAGIIR